MLISRVIRPHANLFLIIPRMNSLSRGQCQLAAGRRLAGGRPLDAGQWLAAGWRLATSSAATWRLLFGIRDICWSINS